MFCHTPPLSIRVHRRWPQSTHRHHSWVPHEHPLLRTLHLIWPFLTSPDRATCRRVSSAFCLGPYGTSLSFNPPWPVFRRRRWGFGKVTTGRSLSHDQPSPYLIIHFAWSFLSVTDRKTLLQFPLLRRYASSVSLRAFGSTSPTPCSRRDNPYDSFGRTGVPQRHRASTLRFRLWRLWPLALIALHQPFPRLEPGVRILPWGQMPNTPSVAAPCGRRTMLSHLHGGHSSSSHLHQRAVRVAGTRSLQ
jgi:hypothetical protein